MRTHVSYETISHKKVSSVYDVCIAIPTGKKVLIWFTFHQKYNACYVLELNRDKKIISKLVKHNHEIGAHTHSHYKLSNLNFEEFQVEIEKNLEILSEFTNQIKSFAIPYGMRRYSNKKQIDYFKKGKSITEDDLF